MLSNFKLPSRPSSSSSGSLKFKLHSRASSSSSGSIKILNLNDVEHMIDQSCQKKDLFDILLEEGNNSPNQSLYLNLHKQFRNSQVLKTIQNLNLSPRQISEAPSISAQGQGCKCTKIDCLKLYCECFAKGNTCGSSCICVCCKNVPQNHEQIYHAKQITNYKHPQYFNGIPPLIPIRRCTCKKSLCKKKYCECFNAGLKCTEQCECCDCHNGGSNFDREFLRGRMEIQVQA